jgi:Protein of unknown function (DUF3551)
LHAENAVHGTGPAFGRYRSHAYRGDQTMRVLLSAAFAAGAAISVGMISTSAQARDYPFCIKAEWYLGGPGDCAFDTYEQCLASASGRRAYCDVNPSYVARDRPRRGYSARRQNY